MSVGLEDYHLIAVWDWKKGKVLASVRGHTDRVSALTATVLNMLTHLVQIKVFCVSFLHHVNNIPIVLNVHY